MLNAYLLRCEYSTCLEADAEADTGHVRMLHDRKRINSGIRYRYELTTVLNTKQA